MFCRPEGVSDGEVVRVLSEGWGLHGAEVEYAPIGFGSHHWQVRRGGDRWFATMDDLRARRRDDSEPLVLARDRLTAALAGARWLRDTGLDFVVAPLPDASGAVLRSLGERYLIALYPFIEGQTYSWDTGLDARTRVAVLGRLAQLHAVSPGGYPVEVAVALAEDFVLPMLTELGEAMAHLDAPWSAGPFAEPTRGLLTRHAAALTAGLERYRALVASVRERSPRYVFAHGEPHPGNLIGTEAGIALIDWDTLLLAPPERDLWSLHDDDPGALDLYRELTGRVVDPGTMQLYRLRWDLAEICLYIAQFRRPHERSDDTREAWEGLQHSLNPTRLQPVTKPR